MKIIVILATVAALATSCTNKNTVNILIANTHNNDTTDVVVQVPIESIIQHLDTESVDSLVLLDEKNQRIDFTVTHGNQNIEFVVPIVKARSQKNYSLNTSANKLSESIFSFRSTSINVNL